MTFSALQNLHAGRPAVVIGKGPTLDAWLACGCPQPAGAVRIGVNHVGGAVACDYNVSVHSDQPELDAIPGVWLRGIGHGWDRPFRKVHWRLPNGGHWMLTGSGIPLITDPATVADCRWFWCETSSTQPAIQLAWYLGCDSLLLIGIDGGDSQAQAAVAVPGGRSKAQDYGRMLKDTRWIADTLFGTRWRHWAAPEQTLAHGAAGGAEINLKHTDLMAEKSTSKTPSAPAVDRAAPLFGFRLARLAVWNQSQKTHKNISGIGVDVYAGGVDLTALIHRDNISRYLSQHPQIEGEYEVQTSLGKMYVKPQKFGDNCASVRLAIDPNQNITDEGWIKGLDAACDAVWQKPNTDASQRVPTGEKWKYDGIYGPGGLPGYGHSNHGAKALEWLVQRHTSVLDVGCGHNEFVKAWRVKKGEMENGSDGVVDSANSPLLHHSTTPSPPSALGCDFACPGADIITPATDLPFTDHQFDLVTAFDVLEHLPEAEVMPALREMARVSRWYCCSIATRPSTILWQGHNLHPTVRPLDWWLDRIREAGGVPEPGPPGYVYGRWSGERRATSAACPASAAVPAPGGGSAAR